MKNALVFGTGETAYTLEKDFPDVDFSSWDSWGVNDIFKIRPVNHLVCVNHSHDFTGDRLQTIVKSKPKKFYTHLKSNWIKHFPELVHFQIGGPTDIEAPYISTSVTSAFCALILAVKCGYENILIAGVDLKTHRNLSTNTYRNKLKNHVQIVMNQYSEKGGKLWVSSDFSILSEVLPVYM